MKIIRITSLLLCFFLIGCNGVSGEVSYKPPVVPLKVIVDINKTISFEVAAEADIPTPIGTFSVGVVVDPDEYFHKGNTLTIRMDCEDHVYNLNEGEDFDINFEPGYYEKISIIKHGNNIQLELKRRDENSTQREIVCPIPTSELIKSGYSSLGEHNIEVEVTDYKIAGTHGYSGPDMIELLLTNNDKNRSHNIGIIGVTLWYSVQSDSGADPEILPQVYYFEDETKTENRFAVKLEANSTKVIRIIGNSTADISGVVFIGGATKTLIQICAELDGVDGTKRKDNILGDSPINPRWMLNPGPPRCNQFHPDNP